MFSLLGKNLFVRNSLTSVGGSLLAGIFNYLFHFIVSRKLSVGEYGELQTLFALFTILTVFVTAASYFVINYASAFARENDIAATRGFMRWLDRKLYGLLAALLVVLALLAPVLSRYLHLNDIGGILVIYGGVALAIAAVSATGALNAWQYFFIVNLLASIGSAVKLVSGYFFAEASPSATMVSLCLLLTGIVGLALARYFARKKFPRAIAPASSGWKAKYFAGLNTRRAVGWVFIFSLMVVLLGNLDILVVKNVTTAELTGYYSVLKILGVIIFTINMAIIQVLLPHASGLGHKGENVSGRLLGGVYALIGGSTLAATVLYYLFPHFIIALLFGHKYDIFAGSLWLFGIMVLFLSILMIEAHIAFARQNFKISYVLGGVGLGMVSTIYLFHNTINQLALGITFFFALGYVCAAAINWPERFGRKTLHE